MTPKTTPSSVVTFNKRIRDCLELYSAPMPRSIDTQNVAISRLFADDGKKFYRAIALFNNPFVSRLSNFPRRLDLREN